MGRNQIEIILQNQQADGRQTRPTRQLCRKKSYRLDIEDLLDTGELDTGMMKWCQHRLDDGAVLILWSERGKGHAREEARRLGIESLFLW